jgi:hypothetical protein
MDENIRQKLNRVYGRGFHDGMKAAIDEPTKELTMNESRFNAVYRGVSEQAKKVYQAVPLNEAWSMQQIMAELIRTTGQREHRVVSGCLNSLRDLGLVREVSPGSWMRIEVRAKVATTNTEPETPKKEPEVPASNTKPAEEKSNITPLERIGGLTTQVLAIIKSMQQLAADIEVAALDVEEQIEKIQKDSARLKQLQELLKGLQN